MPAEQFPINADRLRPILHFQGPGSSHRPGEGGPFDTGGRGGQNRAAGIVAAVLTLICGDLVFPDKLRIAEPTRCPRNYTIENRVFPTA